MIVQPESLVLPVTKALTTILQQLIDQSAIDTANGVVINFRDPDYSAKYVGYHPDLFAIETPPPIWAWIKIDLMLSVGHFRLK
jgi:hypothetical protein